MRFKTLLITGTDTGVGKTTVACGIAAALHRRHYAVGVFKPAETGCVALADGAQQAADAEQLRFFSQSHADRALICPYTFRDPLAPWVAAQREGMTIDVDHVVECCEQITATHDLTLVETAGGLLVPLTATVSFAELAPRLDCSLVVVVASRLGAINHALLTVRHAHALGLEVKGYIVNLLTAEPDLAAQTNIAVLTELLGPPIGVVPYLANIETTDECRERLAEVCTTALDLDRLLEAN